MTCPLIQIAKLSDSLKVNGPYPYTDEFTETHTRISLSENSSIPISTILKHDKNTYKNKTRLDFKPQVINHFYPYLFSNGKWSRQNLLDLLFDTKINNYQVQSII